MADEHEPHEAAPAPGHDADSPAGGYESLLRGDPRHTEGRALLRALQRSAGNSAVLGLLRTVAPPRIARDPAPGAGVLVSEAAGPGQMTLPAFFDLVEERVKAVAERELEDTIYRAAGCPWIDHWIAHYRARSPDRSRPRSAATPRGGHRRDARGLRAVI